MTITLDLPPQVEQAYRAEAQARGLFLDAIIRETLIMAHAKSMFEQGLGLFGDPEDTTLLDEVVAIAYEERRQATKLSITR